MREAAPGVFVRPRRTLHDSVEGEVRERNDLAHGSILLDSTAGSKAVFSPYTNGLRPDRHVLTRRQEVELKLWRQRVWIEELRPLIAYVVHKARRGCEAKPSIRARSEEFVELLARHVCVAP